MVLRRLPHGGGTIRTHNGDQRLLPIWHEISRDEIAKQSPSLVDRIARNTALSTVTEIANEIAAVVQDAFHGPPRA